MHPEADAFLDAIFDHPDDDTPRLVYADWLQEHGQENYAQFIRLQCAAAREKLWSDEANRLWEEIGRVWNRLDDEWCLALRGFSWLDAWQFDRGWMQGGLEIPPEEFTDAVLWWPEWVFADITIDFGAQKQSPRYSTENLGGTAKLHRLAFRGRDAGGIVPTLLRCSLNSLRSLDLSGLQIADELYLDLFAAHLPRLRLLRLPAVPGFPHDVEQQFRERFAGALEVTN